VHTCTAQAKAGGPPCCSGLLPIMAGAALPREAEPPDNPMDPPLHKRFRGNSLRAAVALGILLSLPRAPVTMAVSCGAGTSYVPATASCCTFSACSANGSATGHVYLGGVFDVSSAVGYADYTKHHFTLAVDLINNHTDGLWDDVLTDAQIQISMADSDCNELKAAPAYWGIRDWGQPLHGVIGCRCSAASMAVAAVARLEQVPQISFSSTSARLSDKTHFPYFFRTVTPDGPKGGGGAMVQLMRSFGWERVMVLSTDKPWAADTATQFSSLWSGLHSATGQNAAWTGTIPYSGIITSGGLRLCFGFRAMCRSQV
jgi:hypothetical protein